MIDTADITLGRIERLYDQHAADLAKVRRYQRLLFHERFDGDRMRQRAIRLLETGSDLLLPVQFGRLSPAQFDDIACEITYLLLRDERPQTVVEISPCGGWSTSWMLQALRDNGCGHLHSFDVIDHSVAKVPIDLAAGIRTFRQGDVTRSQHIPDSIDFLFMDSDHTGPFAEWYVQNVFPRVRAGGVVVVDDVFQPGGPAASGGEGPVVLDWLRQRGIPWFTVAHSENRAGHSALRCCKERLQLAEPIITVPGVDPALWFVMPG